MAGGAALAANGLDNALAGARTALTGQFHHTLTSQAAGATAQALGASGKTAANITNGVDIAQGLAGGGASIATGVARKAAAGATERALASGAHDTETLAQAGSKAIDGVGEAEHAPGIVSLEPHDPHATAHEAPAASGTDSASEALKNGETLSSGKPPVELDHVFQGEVSPKRGVDAAKGFHHAPGDALYPTARVVRELSPRNAHGVYEAEIEVSKPGTGVNCTKRSTMFPDSMNRDDVVKSLQNAYDNATRRSGNSFTGPSGHGFDVTGYTSGAGADLHIRTGYPVYAK
jgi:hypothetical protein